MAIARIIISFSSNPASATMQRSNSCGVQTHCHARPIPDINGHSTDKKLLSWCQLQDKASSVLLIRAFLKTTKLKDFKETLSPSEHQTNPSSVLSQSGRESTPRERERKLHYQNMSLKSSCQEKIIILKKTPNHNKNPQLTGKKPQH